MPLTRKQVNVLVQNINKNQHDKKKVKMKTHHVEDTGHDIISYMPNIRLYMLPNLYRI